MLPRSNFEAYRLRNIPFFVGNCEVMWNKLMKEVKLQRVAGPFDHIPFEHFIQSPIGLVPKDGECQTRLIFHLSHHFEDGNSVNSHIPAELCSVKYNDLDCVVNICLCLWHQGGG